MTLIILHFCRPQVTVWETDIPAENRKLRVLQGWYLGTVWASDVCLGNCSVQYGGQFQASYGFGQATCSGSLQSQTEVGFWCEWDGSGGAVLMIGGGGHDCQQAEHVIAITEAENASFLEKTSAKQAVTLMSPQNC